ANMPTTREATDYLTEKGVLFMPGKASNAGGVAVSALEMAQNSMRTRRSFEAVDFDLHNIMKDIFRQVSSAAEDYGHPGNYVYGANIAGFRRVVKSMRAQGWV
ncbi:MAG: NADP-specific glutamate dehydrogenase, partial [Clostridiales bacterium]|nr:NADP-specific glutamate dehydrogenase [Clostridiales bacterium]